MQRERMTRSFCSNQRCDQRAINRVIDNVGRSARRSVAKFARALLVATPASVTVTSALSSTGDGHAAVRTH